MVYLSILEKNLIEFIKLGKTTLSKSFIYSFTDNFKTALSSATLLSYANNMEKSVILTLELNKDVGLSNFYIRSLKYLLSKDNNDFTVNGFYKHKLKDKDIETFEAGMSLYLSFEDIFTESFLKTISEKLEEDIYNHLNIKGIQNIETKILINKSKLDDFLFKKLNEMANNENFIYEEL